MNVMLLTVQEPIQLRVKYPDSPCSQTVSVSLSLPKSARKTGSLLHGKPICFSQMQ